MDWKEWIVFDSQICHGQATIRGTRIPVSVILDNLAAGMTSKEIVQSYPSLSPAAVQAAITYAADLTRERVLALPAQGVFMKFKVDENLPINVCQLLQQTGYDCMSVHDQKMTGATDDKLLTVCQSEGRIMLTMDLDFRGIRRYPPASYPGIITLRLEHQDKEHVVSVLRRIIPSLSSEQIENRLWIVDEHKIRVR